MTKNSQQPPILNSSGNPVDLEKFRSGVNIDQSIKSNPDADASSEENFSHSNHSNTPNDSDLTFANVALFTYADLESFMEELPELLCTTRAHGNQLELSFLALAKREIEQIPNPDNKQKEALQIKSKLKGTAAQEGLSDREQKFFLNILTVFDEIFLIKEDVALPHNEVLEGKVSPVVGDTKSKDGSGSVTFV